MRKVSAWQLSATCLLSVAIFLFAYASIAQVINITATVPSPPDTIISFSGIAYPNALVTILEDGLPFLSTSANAQGDFSVAKTNATPGAHTYSLSAEDSLGRDSLTLNIAVNVVFETTTTVSNIFFGPTIVLSTTSLSLGSPITVSGITSPRSSVAIHLTEASTIMYTVTANASGVWTRTFQDELVEGNYSVRVRATDPDTSISEFSDTKNFTVGAPPDPCLTANIADMNCDGDVNLTDLSILLAYWKQTNPGNARTDINGDTTVTIFDFSIMMYHWTGPT